MAKKVGQFQKKVVSVFRALKYNQPCEVSPVVPVYQNTKVTAILRVVSDASCSDKAEIKCLARWRSVNSRWFPSQFRVTIAGTKKWAKEQVLEKEDRILFMIQDLRGHPIGHVGLYRFDYAKRACDIDNIIRGEKGVPGVMTAAVEALLKWGRDALGVKIFTLCCFADNIKAIALYRRCKFVEFDKIPLIQVRKKGMTVWEEQTFKKVAAVQKIQRYFIHMKRVD